MDLKSLSQRPPAYLDLGLSEGGGEVHLVGVRDADVAEVVAVGDAPDGQVVDVVQRQVVGQHEFDIHAIVVPQHLQAAPTRNHINVNPSTPRRTQVSPFTEISILF